MNELGIALRGTLKEQAGVAEELATKPTLKPTVEPAPEFQFTTTLELEIAPNDKLEGGLGAATGAGVAINVLPEIQDHIGLPF